MPFAPVALGGLWAAWNGVGFALNPATRHRAEAAWFIFAAILLLSGLTLGRRLALAGEPSADGSCGEQPATARWLLVFLLLSFALYSPILGIGLLSDDFVLLSRVARGALIDTTWDYVRPFPLAAWWAIDAALPAAVVPFALHAWSVAVHGLNAWLVYLLARRLAVRHSGALIAGLLFLTCPFNVEAVAWGSGTFDIALTALVLITAVVLLSAGSSMALAVGVTSAMTLAAVFTKETAVAFPLLLAALVPFVPRGHRRVMTASITTCAAIVVIYVLWRVSSGIPRLTASPPDGYRLKEILSRPFGLLGLGLHREVLAAVPFLAVIVAVLWPAALVMSATRWSAEPRRFLFLALAAIWVLSSVLPVFTMFYVSPDLEGSRYVYLGSTVWVIGLIAALTSDSAGAVRTRSLVIPVAVVALSAAALLAHQRPWLRAAAERDRVLSALGSLPAGCSLTNIDGMPDTVAGAYVFRNGFAEAVARVKPARSIGAKACAVRWDGTRFLQGR